MGQPRTRQLACAGYFLSRRGLMDPPPELRTTAWATAYAMFYAALADGRRLTAFHNTLKSTRDQFDSYVPNARRGWHVGAKPKPLPDIDRAVYEYWRKKTDAELWAEVRPWAALELARYPKSVLRDLESLDEQDLPDTTVEAIEGGTKFVVSKRIERDPRLRGEALRIHGCSCAVCRFNFGDVYGAWGRDYAEVHHLRPFSVEAAKRVTNARSDLVVLCANCHRMVHRKRGRLMSPDELRSLIDWTALAAWAEAGGGRNP
jgi:5-methylcytosine-specific restriction enzyme A